MKPTVPAVAGSMRRNSAGASERPMSRARRQPRITSAIAVTTRTGSVDPEHLLAVVVQGEEAGDQRDHHASSIRARAARCAAWTVSARARAAGWTIGDSARSMRGIIRTNTYPASSVSRCNRVCGLDTRLRTASPARTSSRAGGRCGSGRAHAGALPEALRYGVQPLPGRPAARSIRRRSGSATYARPRA